MLVLLVRPVRWLRLPEGGRWVAGPLRHRKRRHDRSSPAVRRNNWHLLVLVRHLWHSGAERAQRVELLEAGHRLCQFVGRMVIFHDVSSSCRRRRR